MERPCIHNKACFCNEPRCSTKCGWNPKGAEARQKKIRTDGLTTRADGMCCLVVKRKGGA